ncbi:MAG: glycosyltransferase N-terminal domain-containing protein [Pseudomonadota bacterium]
MILYRLLLTLLAPGLAVFFLLRILRGREDWLDLAERLSLDRERGTRGARTLWLHGASHGELTAARPVLDAMLARAPNLSVVVTSNTTTARGMVRAWELAQVEARLAPLDYRRPTARFFRRFRPGSLIVVENELWPNRLLNATAMACPVALVGARLSAQSGARWQRLAGALRPHLRRVVFASPHDAASAALLAALGVPQAALGQALALKSAVALPSPDRATQAALGFERADTVLAASTHAGEEEIVLAAFAAARARRPERRLILAPRHPRRAAEILDLVAAAGLGVAQRSAGETPGEAPVYLADTMGEMPLWYAAAGTCFVGGSLVAKGGHTPFEPAQFGCALLTGPHVENAADAFARLRAADAVVTVRTADELVAAIETLTGTTQRERGARARAALAPDDLGPLSDTLLDVLGLRPSAAPGPRP